MSGFLANGHALGDYEILEVAGVGGMGVVYRARQRSLNRVIALKVIRDEVAQTSEFRERFWREAQLAAAVDHPHIVSVYGVTEHAGRLVLAMQWVEGQDLRAILRSFGGLQPERAVTVLGHVAGALDAIHSMAGLVHRDVKPSNVLLRDMSGADHAYLTDFGVAKRSDTAADLTTTGAVVGTVDYMAPEQIRGERTDARTDIYALGCVFFEMLSGRVPFDRENSVAKLFAHISDPPPRLPGPLATIYPTFGPVLEKAMAKSPADRYLSAGDFARDAAAALRGTRFTGPPSVVATGEARPAPATRIARPEHAATVTDQGSPHVAPMYEAAAFAASLTPPAAYPQYPHPTPTAPPRSRAGSPLVLVLLALLALIGLAAATLAATGLLSPHASPATAGSAKQASAGSRAPHPALHHASQRTNPSGPRQPAPSTTQEQAPPQSRNPGYGVGALPVQCGYGVAGSAGMTCRFANNAFYEYWRASGGDSALSESVSAWSALARRYYSLTCVPGDGVVDCTGHNSSGIPLDARFTQRAVSLYTNSQAAAYAASGKPGPNG